jgi:hypothetical protein
MITPNKAITIEESALGKAPVILKQGPDPVDLIGLFELIGSKFDSIDQFLLTLDVLYVLGRINLDAATRILTYAD